MVYFIMSLMELWSFCANRSCVRLQNIPRSRMALLAPTSSERNLPFLRSMMLIANRATLTASMIRTKRKTFAIWVKNNAKRKDARHVGRHPQK